MLNQSFSSKNFAKLLRKNDFIDYSLGDNTAQYLERLSVAADTILNDSFQFSPFRTHKLSHGIVISPSCLEDDFAIRKLNDNIKRVFNVKTVDRNRIIPQVKVLLGETCEYWLQKLDLTKFFESVKTEEILKIIYDDPRLSYDSKKLLKKLFSCSDISGKPGLPRGISLSSTMSELYMDSFDNSCRTLENCYFYTRYVDDIILLLHDDPKNLVAELENFLPPGLSFNREKCESLHRPRQGAVSISNDSKAITYLGYEFSFAFVSNKKPSELQVGIAEKKIKKIKTRVMLSLFDFCKTQNYDLLKSRFRFLSSNYRIGQDSGHGNLYAGIHYNHSMIDEERLDDLKSIDNFVKKAVFSKNGSLGRRLNSILSLEQKRELCSFSLLLGHQKKMVRNFEPEQFFEIKSVWRHV